MKYSAIVLAVALCACASHNAPPAESAAAVQAATDTPDRGPNFAPAAPDGESAARADQNAHAVAPNGATSSSGRASSSADNATGPDSATASSSRSQDSASTPTTSADGTRGTSSASPPYPNNATALPAQNPPVSDYEADNTRVNARDRRGTTLTPMDQGSSEADRKLTQQIRETIVRDNSLSFTAKNVKIITLNGRVTLRGPVKTDAERRTISAAAKKIAGDAQVENYLEVAK